VTAAMGSPGEGERVETSRILAAGAAVALLDIGYAAVLWVVILQVLTPVQLLQSIATGLLGKAAYAGGAATAALGAGLHLTIAYGWSVVYLAAYRSWPALRRRVVSRSGAVQVGLLLGVLIWLAMDLIVLPLSRARPTPVLSGRFVLNLVAHAVLVGLPIALLIRGNPRR